MVVEEEIWLSQKKIKDFDGFKENVEKTGIMKSSRVIPFASMSEVAYNNANDLVTLKYTNEKGSQKKMEIDFGDKKASNEFGNLLGNELGFNKNEAQEKQWKPLLFNVLYIVIAIAGTFFLATIENTDDLADGSSRRSRRNGAIIKLIVDTLGQTGVIVVGSGITLYLVYSLYKRFKNPANEVVFTR